RVRIEQEFYRYGLAPPADLIETSSYFVMATFVNRRGATAFVARSVGQYFEREGWCKILPLDVAVEVAPVGLITLRGQRLTTTTGQLITCLRQAVGELFGDQAAGVR
ncbi:MAG: LysR family transcriptional regulator, partial [Pollutimonas bauzanensis]